MKSSEKNKKNSSYPHGLEESLAFNKKIKNYINKNIA